MPQPSPEELRVLVCAPIGRDGSLTADFLGRAGVPVQVCASLAELTDQFIEAAGAILLTEEALGDHGLDSLANALAAQPAWSDISVLLFTGGDRNDASLRTLRKLEVLRNVTLLDRPVRAAAVVSTVQAALRGRRRQYELRDVLVALHKSRMDAEHANRLKDEFLATVSHELRTPLNAILGWVSMLRQVRFEPERVASVLEIVERNAKAQAQIIADILDISRMITGRVKLELAPVSLGRVVVDALDTVRPGALAKRIEIHSDVDEGPIVHADAERLQQVFWNVLSNACKFTPAEGRIDVALVEHDGRAIVRIADSGVGIGPEFLPYVFDRFRQADQTFTRAYGGLGLGLAIVKHLTEMHGGEVSATSEGSGKGSTFEIALPVMAPARKRRRVRAPAADALDNLPDVKLDGRTILLVDDDQSTRELMVALLGRHGATVTTAENAIAAIAHFDVEIPALLIADIGMPGEDGLSMLRRIRQRPAGQGGNIPAIALSAYARLEDKRAARDAGYEMFLAKPALPAEILRAVDRVLSAASAR